MLSPSLAYNLSQIHSIDFTDFDQTGAIMITMAK